MRISDWSSDVCSSDLLAYALGSPATISSLLNSGNLLDGTLNYSLEAGYVVNTSNGQDNALTALDMTVTLNTLDAPKFQVNHLAGGQFTDFYMGTPVDGEWTSGNDLSTFQFEGAQAGGGSDCGGCVLDMAGFFAGDQGAQAGVTFR